MDSTTERHTARLLLRPFHADDVDDVLAYADDSEYGRFIPVPQPYSRRDADEFVAQAMLRADTDPMWAIVHEGHVRGAIELDVDRPNRRGELHFALARSLWRQGLTTEAAFSVVGYAFDELQLNRVFARADIRNVGSWRVLEKIGMTREGILRSNRVVGRESVDDVLYALLRDEWPPRGL